MAKSSGSTKRSSSSNPKGITNGGNIIIEKGMFDDYKVMVGFKIGTASAAKSVVDNYIYTEQKVTNGESANGVRFYKTLKDSTIKGYIKDYKYVDKLQKELNSKLDLEPNSVKRASIEAKYEKKLLDYIEKRKKQLNN